MTRSGTLAIVAIVLGTGCANLTSIERTTWLPGRDKDSEGVAIHLDAKQRLAFAKSFGIVCAEPSPDALSAFAASFGGGVSVPQYGSASMAQALSESAGSIGLRTQSITLMRDTLYRVCEAYYNKAINQVMVMQLLGRTQDLTLGILAIEQLTRPIVAQQASLGGTAGATSSANVMATQAILDKLQDDEKQKNDRLVQAQADLAKSDEAVKSKDNELKKEQQQATPDSEKIKTLNTDLKALQDKRKENQAAVDRAQEQVDQARKSREAAARNATSATANTSSSASFSMPIVLGQPPSEQSVQQVAAAVTEIVKTVVGRDHTRDACLAMISSIFSKRAQLAAQEARGGVDARTAQEEKKEFEKDVRGMADVSTYCVAALGVSRSSTVK